MEVICTYVDFVENIEERKVTENCEIYKSLNLNGESDYDNFTLALAYFVQRKRNLFDFFVEFCKSTEDNYLIESVVRQWVRHLGQNLNVDTEFHDNYVVFIGRLFNKGLITNRLLQTEVIGRLACVCHIKLHLLAELLSVIQPELLINSDIDFSFIAYLKLIVDDDEMIFSEGRNKQLKLKNKIACLMPVYIHLLPNDNTILTHLESLFEDINSDNYFTIFDRLKPIKYKNLIILKQVLNLVVPFLKTRPKNVYLYAKLIANFVQNNVLELGKNFKDEAKLIKYAITGCLEKIRVQYFPNYDRIFEVFEKCLMDLAHVIEFDVSLLIGLKCNEIKQLEYRDHFEMIDNPIEIEHAKQKSINQLLANISNLSKDNFDEILTCKGISEIDTYSDLSKMMLIFFQKFAENKSLQEMYEEILKKMQNHVEKNKFEFVISDLLKKYPKFRDEIEFKNSLVRHRLMSVMSFDKILYKVNRNDRYSEIYKNYVSAESAIITYLIDKLTLEDGKDFQDSLTKYVLTKRNLVYLMSEMIKRVLRMRPDLVNGYIDLYSRYLNAWMMQDNQLFSKYPRNRTRKMSILDTLISYFYANKYVVSAFIKKFRYLKMISFNEKEKMFELLRNDSRNLNVSYFAQLSSHITRFPISQSIVKCLNRLYKDLTLKLFCTKSNFSVRLFW